MTSSSSAPPPVLLPEPARHDVGITGRASHRNGNSSRNGLKIELIQIEKGWSIV